MLNVKINDRDVSVEPGTLIIEACHKAGFGVPHYCYHAALKPVATCRMCMVEVKGQPKLVASCATTVTEGMEVVTQSDNIADNRAGVMEFLLLNHPLDCPICDQAGECALQDYSYNYGSGDSRMVEPKRRYRYEDLGAKIVIDKNRCIHCTRCVRFTQEVSGTGELIVAQRGAELEVTTYSGKTMDSNPLAGNVVDLCPVGALTSKDFRFTKRVWYLKPIPTISRHGVLASPIWADVDENRIWRFRPRVVDGKPNTAFIFDEERFAWHRYDLDPATRITRPMLKGEASTIEAVTTALQASGAVAVVAQGTFGCDATQHLGALASHEDWRFGSGDRHIPITYPTFQPSSDGIFNRKGLVERGYRFGSLDTLENLVRQGAVRTVVMLHDNAFSSAKETEQLQRILAAINFSLLLEPIPSALAALATATLPVTTYLEESDFVVNLQGDLCRYHQALTPPAGIKPVPTWTQTLTQTCRPDSPKTI